MLPSISPVFALFVIPALMLIALPALPTSIQVNTREFWLRLRKADQALAGALTRDRPHWQFWQTSN